MEQKRIGELLKAARERINGPPGSRGITFLPEEVLEVLEGNLVVETSQDVASSNGATPTTQAATGGPWDAIGRIAAAYIAKQPPGLTALRIVNYTSEIIAQIEGRLSD